MVSTKIGRIMDPRGKKPELRKDVVSPGFAGGSPPLEGEETPQADTALANEVI